MDSLGRVGLALLMFYLSVMGATWNGVLMPPLKWLNLALIAGLALLWLIARRRGRWTWHRNPLDGALLLWALAFGVALLANLESWRRIVMGLWYVGLYVGVWFVLADALTNRALRRETLIDALLLGGLAVVAFGYVQMWLQGLRFTGSVIGSVIGNPNSLGAYLIVLLGLGAGRWLGAGSRLARGVLGGYLLLIVILLLLTFSRGAWIGGAATVIVLGGLALLDRGAVSWDWLRDWWRARAASLRTGLLGLSMALIAGGLAFAVLVAWPIFSAPGRDPGLRLALWSGAAQMFGERPLSGHGLFTFGQQLPRIQSQPPRQPHSHAHNGPLHIAAELGLPGLAALVASVGVLLAAMRRNWRAVPARQRLTLAGALAASMGYGFHHLVDLPAMMPLIALVGLLALSVATAPLDPIPARVGWRQQGPPRLVALLLAALLVSGVWSASIYDSYDAAIRHVLADDAPVRDYRGGAQRMQAAVDADPSLALYHSQQGYLYALAALENGDDSALPSAIRAYERLTELEPGYAVGWANLGAVYWAAGDPVAALAAFENAVQAAPDSLALWFNLGLHAEQAGDESLARRAYTQALDAQTQLWPEWQATPLRREIAATLPLEPVSALALALADDAPLSPDEAERLWQAAELDTRQGRGAALRLLLELRAGIPGDYAAQLAQVERQLAHSGRHQQGWLYLVRAEHARHSGDEARAAAEFARARQTLILDITDADFTFGTNIAHFQFLRYTLPRQFLPTVFYPAVSDGALRYLLLATA